MSTVGYSEVPNSGANSLVFTLGLMGGYTGSFCLPSLLQGPTFMDALQAVQVEQAVDVALQATTLDPTVLASCDHL
jgi:hypothetical protein